MVGVGQIHKVSCPQEQRDQTNEAQGKEPGGVICLGSHSKAQRISLAFIQASSDYISRLKLPQLWQENPLLVHDGEQNSKQDFTIKSFCLPWPTPIYTIQDSRD